MGQVKKRADGYIEKKRKINGKVVHFYGKTTREVQRKIDEALENAVKAKKESEVFDIVAEQWWKDYLKRIKAGNARAYHGAYVSILEFFGGYAMTEITPSRPPRAPQMDGSHLLASVVCLTVVAAKSPIDINNIFCKYVFTLNIIRAIINTT